MKRTFVRTATLLTLLCATAWSGFSQGRADYKISPLDVLVIDLVGEADLRSREFRVSKTGTIDYPYLEKVEVAGKTPAEVKDLLTEMLDKDYFVNPQLTVDIKSYNVREIFVTGQVNKPGSIELPGEKELTIMDAIGRAGSLTTRGNPNKIKFIRPGQPERVFKLDDLRKNESDKDRIVLQPGDSIEVEDKLF